MHLIQLVGRSLFLSSFLFHCNFGDTKLQMASPDFNKKYFFMRGTFHSLQTSLLACVTAPSPRKKNRRRGFLTFSIPFRSAQDKANKFNSTRKLPRVVRHLYSLTGQVHKLWSAE